MVFHINTSFTHQKLLKKKTVLSIFMPIIDDMVLLTAVFGYYLISVHNSMEVCSSTLNFLLACIAICVVITKIMLMHIHAIV